ncbi:hypothetical protein J6590_035215 [Homalodisca vitripennis]|nr:hypothetical protein J6590_035215 [Homalodisca vitripennis]
MALTVCEVEERSRSFIVLTYLVLSRCGCFDVTKTFDIVSHITGANVLVEFGVPQRRREYVTSLCERSWTVCEVEERSRSFIVLTYLVLSRCGCFDVTKTFDIVSHITGANVLVEFGVPQRRREYVTSLCERSWTVCEVGERGRSFIVLTHLVLSRCGCFDVTKTFDIVSHITGANVLVEFGVPQRRREYVTSLCERSWTVCEVGERGRSFIVLTHLVLSRCGCFDVTKTFDIVSHITGANVLVEFGVPQRLREYVTSVFERSLMRQFAKASCLKGTLLLYRIREHEIESEDRWLLQERPRPEEKGTMKMVTDRLVSDQIVWTSLGQEVEKFRTMTEATRYEARIVSEEVRSCFGPAGSALS